MKWIGQHIWDFISRFRSDVYLESVDSGTIASGGNLGLDSNNKIVKAGNAMSFDGSTADGVCTYKDTDEISVEDTFTYSAVAQTMMLTGSGAGSTPQIQIKNSNTASTGPLIKFDNTANGADDDTLGTIGWSGDDEGGGTHTYAMLKGEIADATPGEEAGRLKFFVAEYDGTSTTAGLILDGNTDADGEIDVTIGAGAGSTTTVSGGLTVTGASISFSNLPTSDPGVAGKLWNDSGTLKISS